MACDANRLIRKARRLHMNAQVCYEFGQSDGGASRLVNPATYKTSSKDPNRGLYPRERYKPRLLGQVQHNSLGSQQRRMGNMLRGTEPTAGPSSGVSDVASIVGDGDCRLQDFLDDDVLEGTGYPVASSSHSVPDPRGGDTPLAGFQSAKLFMSDSANTISQSGNASNLPRAGKTKRPPKYVAQQPSLENVWITRNVVLPESTNRTSEGTSTGSGTQVTSNQLKVDRDCTLNLNKLPSMQVRTETLTYSEVDLLRSPSKAIAPSRSPSLFSVQSPRNVLSSVVDLQNITSTSSSSRGLKRTISASDLNSNCDASVSCPSATALKQPPGVSSPKFTSSPSKCFKPDFESFSPKKRRQNAKVVQKNTLFNYFVTSPKKSSIPSEVTVKQEPEVSDAQTADEVKSEDDVLYVCSVKASKAKQPSKQQGNVASVVSATIPCLVPVASSSKSSSSSSVQGNTNNLPDEFKDLYGLFGNMEDDIWDDVDETISKDDPFQQLPNEVLEHIFCHFAMTDLCLILSRVCKRWNEVISREKFLAWKKTYNRLKKGHVETGEAIAVMCSTYEMISSEVCLVSLIRFMKGFKVRNIPNVLSCLSWHPKYKCALALLYERLPDCLTQKEPDPWCLIAILCILSDSVEGILTIQSCLTHSNSCCTTLDMMECLYCIATFLFYFKREYRLNSGYHYRLYYALYLFENKGTVTVGELGAFSAKTSGQQSIRKYGNRSATTRLTHEQLRIVNHNLQPNQLVKIVAFAGTGKTTTLIEFTKLWPSKTFLNVSYNKSVSEHAKKVFPRNVNCRTIHSLAYGGVGHRFKGKLKYKVTSFDVAQVLDGSNTTVRAARALKTIEKFVNTADSFITIAHVPERPSRASADEPPPTPYSDQERLEMAADATVVWESMKNPADYRTRVTHDVYLKLYQLAQPTIADIDCLLIDEAQDCNGAMLDVITSQRCPKILVGDPHQQIYSFRGAVNALDSVIATHVYYLTQSFRFGPEIGYVASCALEVMKKEHMKTIVGGAQKGGFDGQEEGQVAVIARTNMNLFLEAVRLCCQGNKPIHGTFLGGISTYNFNQASDIYKLMQASNGEGTKESLGIRDNFIKRFSSFAKLCDYAKKADDIELLGKIKLVQLFGHRLPQMIVKITEQCNHPLEMADYVFSTAHKSKGHEFDTVRLTEDYVTQQFRVVNELLEYTGKGPDLDEANILYVAITRAKKRLILTPQLIIMMLAAGDIFEKTHWAKDLKKQPSFESGNWTCVVCQEERTQSAEKVLCVTREKITTTRFAVPSGILCYVCSSLPVVNLSDYHVVNELHLVGLEYIRSPTHDAFRPLVGPLTVKETEEAERFYEGLTEEPY